MPHASVPVGLGRGEFHGRARSLFGIEDGDLNHGKSPLDLRAGLERFVEGCVSGLDLGIDRDRKALDRQGIAAPLCRFFLAFRHMLLRWVSQVRGLLLSAVPQS
jgi:hypothetical protein